MLADSQVVLRIGKVILIEMQSYGNANTLCMMLQTSERLPVQHLIDVLIRFHALHHFPHEKRHIDELKHPQNIILFMNCVCKTWHFLSGETEIVQKLSTNNRTYKLSHKIWVMRLLMIEITSHRCGHIQIKLFQHHLFL